jgi:hypothetical protein
MASSGISAEDLLAFALALPDTGLRQYDSSTAVTFRERGILYVDRDGELAQMKATQGEREALLASRPDIYSPRHTSGRFGWVEVRLDAVDPDEMRALVEEAWRQSAPKRMVADYDHRDERMSP